MNAASPCGLILLAHGARDPRWAEPFERVAAQVRAARPHNPVALAYLEFMSPDLPTAAAGLAAAGCARIDVLPLFLGSAGHVRRDVPHLLKRLEAEHEGLSLVLHPAAGEMPALIQAMADAAIGLLPPDPDASSEPLP